MHDLALELVGLEAPAREPSEMIGEWYHSEHSPAPEIRRWAEAWITAAASLRPGAARPAPLTATVRTYLPALTASTPAMARGPRKASKPPQSRGGW